MYNWNATIFGDKHENMIISMNSVVTIAVVSIDNPVLIRIFDKFRETF